MSKIKLGVSVTLALLVPAVAQAKPPTQQHVRQYLREYHAVRHEFGARAAGCNLIERKGSCHVRATDARVLKSLAVLGRDLAPPPAPVAVVQPVSVTTAPSANVTYTSVEAAPATSGLAQCIISRESGGNARAVNRNGHYGIAQWDVATWLAQGGGKYSATPLGASASQQEAVLNNALANGEASAWTPYDGCHMTAAR